MGMESAKELFLHELGDALDAETKLAVALERMAKKVNNESLADLLTQHQKETKEQIERIKQVFQSLDEKIEKQPCKGMAGLLSEATDFFREERPKGDIANIAAISASQKVERYEITAYESLIALAKHLGLEEEAAPLTESLNEEKRALERLTELGKEVISMLPAEEEEEDEEEMAMAESGNGSAKRSRSK